MGGIDLAPGLEGLQDRLDEAVAGIAREPLAVGPEIRKFAASIPDSDGRRGRYLLGTGQGVEGFHFAQVVGQLAVAAGLLQGVELYALGRVVLDQLAQVLLVADIARAGRVPEVHQADRAGA